MSALEISFGDTVRLGTSDIGIVSFIGHTHFKKDTIFYGINLKESKGKHNGTYDKIQYFKCSRNHGVFTDKGNIIEIIKKHSLSASFHYEQDVSIINNIGNGKILYIGLTKYDGFQNYFYGVKLNKNLKEKYIEQIKKNPHIYYLYNNDNDYKTNEYFDADLKHSIFVRQNQLRKLNNSNESKSKQNSKSAAKNKQKYLKIRQQNGGRSMSMQPRKKTKNKAKLKSKKPSTPTSTQTPTSISSNSSSNSKKKTSIPSTQKNATSTSKNGKKKTLNTEKNKNKNKNKSNNAKSLAKRKKIREMRMSNAIQSDLGAIRKSKARRKAKLNNAKSKAKQSKPAKQPKSPKSPNSTKKPKIVIPNSKQNDIKFNGCSTPTKPNKSKSKSKPKSKTNNKKKSVKQEPMHRPTLSKANSASYVASEKQKKKKAIAEKKKAIQTAALKQKPKKKNTTKTSSKKKKTNKIKSYHTRKRSSSSNSSSNRTATTPKINSMSRSVSSSTSSKTKGNKKGKSKKKKRKRYTVDDTHIINKKKKNNKLKSKFHIIHEDEEDDDDMLSYQDIINDKDKFLKYIDNKNFYYHRQFINKNDKEIVSEIKERAPPPSMVSFFSSKSRVNQRKKRALPSAPKTYTITIRTRPLGFFIETRKLNTIIQDKESGEHKSEQVEIVDKKNKFNKVNAYISSIASEEWQSILIVGSQLLSINDQSITGLSFSNIFQQLSQQQLPFDLKLAAPRDHDINMDELNINNSSNNNLPGLSMNVISNDSDISSINSEITSPDSINSNGDNGDNGDNQGMDINGYETSSNNSSSNWNGISDIPRGRGQTIDETKLSKQTEKKKNKFRFRLF